MISLNPTNNQSNPTIGARIAQFVELVSQSSLISKNQVKLSNALAQENNSGQRFNVVI